MSLQMINHRGTDFAALVNRVTEKLKNLFQTTSDVLIMTSSGTGGIKTAVVNTLLPGDNVLVVIIGEFGERFAQIVEPYGAVVKRLLFDYGTAADPNIIERELKANPSCKAVLVTHNETFTGVTNDLATITAVKARNGLDP